MSATYASLVGTLVSELPLSLPAAHEPPHAPSFVIRDGTSIRASSIPDESWVRPDGTGAFAVAGIVRFEIDLAQRSVTVRAARGIDAEIVEHLLVDHFLPRLADRQAPCFHAACVVIDGRGVVVVGASGAGKSTLAARLGMSGGEVLGDDCAWISDGWVQPTFRPCRLDLPSLGHLGLTGTPGAGGKAFVGAEQGINTAVSAVPLWGVVVVGTAFRRLPLSQTITLLLEQRFWLAEPDPGVLVAEASALLARQDGVWEVDRRSRDPIGEVRRALP